MREFFPLIASAIAILLFGSIKILLMFALNRPWWRKKPIRTVSWAMPLFGVAMVALWAVGFWYKMDWLMYPAATLVVLVFVVEVALMLSLPVSGLLHFIHWGVDRFARSRRRKDPDLVDTNRRAFLKGAAVGLPTVAVAMSWTGVARAFGDCRVYERAMSFDRLPLAFDGLRIFHLSDIHLSQLVQLDRLEQILTDAEAFDPDLVLLTGDIADYLPLLPDTLRMVAGLEPRLGAYACLGNHEYFRGVDEVKRVFASSEVPLLIDEGRVLEVDGVPLRVAGLDDPKQMHGDHYEIFRRSIAAATEGEESAFTVLMSHRPSAFDRAAEVGIDLTLAGHTHGGQIGYGERSVFEYVQPGTYLWGEYENNGSRLYTSAGAGHWFPFRLGCPAEAPIITLRRS